jgi:hypothetical protein
MSNDTDTRVVAFKANGAGGAVTANVTNIPTTTTSLDTHGAWNGSVFTVPVSGNYQIFGGAAGPTNASFFAYIDGVQSTEVKVANGTNANGTLSGLLHNLNAGQQVSFRSNVGQTLVAFFVAMTRVSGPATIAASETVAAFASKTSGSHTSSGSWQDVASWSLRDSTHGSFNATTGVFTAPVSGRYLVTGHVAFLGAASGIRAVKIIKISSDTVIGQRQVGSSALNAVVFSGYVQLSAGETVKIQAYQDSSGILGYFTSGEDGTTISIVRVGN